MLQPRIGPLFSVLLRPTAIRVDDRLKSDLRCHDTSRADFCSSWRTFYMLDHRFLSLVE